MIKLIIKFNVNEVEQFAAVAESNYLSHIIYTLMYYKTYRTL